MRHTRTSKLNKILITVIAVCSLLAAVSKLLVGFDIDEGYAIAMPYRFLQGDRLFAEMWEIHQTSLLLPALVMKPYLAITGSTDGIVLYLRIVSALIHLGMTGIFVWTIRALLPEPGSGVTGGTMPLLAAGALYLNMLPKWMLTLDFSVQQLWGLTLLCAGLAWERKNKKPCVSFWTGVALSLTVLAYPAMLILYPALAVVYLLPHDGEEIKSRLKKVFWMTAACILTAALFLGYVMIRLDGENIFTGISNMLSDGTHSMNRSGRMALALSRWGNVGKQWLFFAFGALVFDAAVYIFTTRVMKRKMPYKQAFSKRFCNAALIITSLLLICGEAMGIRMGPFHFQARFLLIFLMEWILSLKYLSVREHVLYYQSMFLVTVSFAGVLLLSNVGPDASSSYLQIGLIMGLYMLLTGMREQDAGWVIQAETMTAVFLFLISVIFCKGFYVRYTEYFPADITQERVRIAVGPLAGIYLLPEDAEVELMSRRLIEKETKNGVKSVLLGTDQILNLSMKGQTVIPSTISTPAFDAQWITYYTMHPQLMPDLVFIAKNTVDDRDKFFAENELGIWLSERYDTEQMTENDALCLIRKKGGVIGKEQK